MFSTNPQVDRHGELRLCLRRWSERVVDDRRQRSTQRLAQPLRERIKSSDGHAPRHLQLEEFVFGEKSQLIVDPAEEQLKTEFSEG